MIMVARLNQLSHLVHFALVLKPIVCMPYNIQCVLITHQRILTSASNHVLQHTSKSDVHTC